MKMESSVRKTRGSTIKNNIWLLVKIWNYTPEYIIGMFIEGILWGLYHSISVIYVQTLFEELGRDVAFEMVAKVIIFYAVYLIIFYVFYYWYKDIYIPKVQEKLYIAMHGDLFKQAVRIDLAKYDNPEFYNDFIWSMDQSNSRAVSLMEDTGKLINRVVASVTLTGVLFCLDEFIAVSIIATAILRICLTYIMNKINNEYREQLNPLTRKSEYINRIFKLADYAKELRMTFVQKPILKEYNNNVDKRKRIIYRYEKKLAINKFWCTSISAICENGLIILILYKIMITGELGLSGFVAAVNACWKMFWFLEDMVDRLLKYHEHGLFIEKVMTFLSCEPLITDGLETALPFESLIIKNLKFSYGKGDTKKNIIDNINMEIRRGERIAIVGYKGAGKTTLTNLKMRLYDPDEGEILYNGKDIKEYTVSSLRKHIAAVFQDYRIFACTLAENVASGECPKENSQKVEDALTKSVFGEKLRMLPNGIQTQLTREFDDLGVNLSVGEQQKVAIARAFYKNADIIILDEPSSALDPDAEYELNNAISEYAETRTVIFISHRLSTTRNADRIYVFDEGKIVETGTHEELIAANGKYAYMFNLQAQNYR